MPIQWKKEPKCEACTKQKAVFFEHTKFHGWIMSCTRCSKKDLGKRSYHIEIEKFFKTPLATVDWMAHIHEKNWMDCKEFFMMIHRLRDQTESFGQ